MKKRINQIAALFFMYLLIVSPFSIAQDESPQQDLPQQDPELEQQQTPEQSFNDDPTPENFDKLPNPTAANLEELVKKGYTPTIDNFNKLSGDQQGVFLSKEQNYRQEFANQYYAEPVNWGKNPKADEVLFKETRFRDLLRTGEAQKRAAAQYFSRQFPADFVFLEIGDDFQYDPATKFLKNGKQSTKVDLPYLETVTAALDDKEPPLPGLKIKFKDAQEVTISGQEERTVQNFDVKGNKISFVDAQGNSHGFTINPSDQKTSFRFDGDKTVITGDVEGKTGCGNDYCQFRNHDGTLVIYSNGNLDAENAEVITSRLFMDGRYSKRGNKIEAWDVGIGGKQTVVVDKNACPEVGACVGVASSGQWDERQLRKLFPQWSEKEIKEKASTLKINLDEVSSTSSFYNDPKKPQPTEEDKAEQLREQAQQLRKPNQPPLPGNNAEVSIHTDKDTQAVTVTSKGVVAVGLYDARGNSAKPLQDKFSYKGLNGLSELDVQFSARTQTNVRGQAKLSNEQFKEGIRTQQDGAVIKVSHDRFDPVQKDLIRADCFDCAAGEAIVIHKSVASATPTNLPGVFAGAERGSVKLKVQVDQQGQVMFEPDLSDLGFLASEEGKGSTVSVGRTLLVSVHCGKLECNFGLSHGGATYQKVDPQQPDKLLFEPVTYSLQVQQIIGNEVVLVSEKNAAEINKLTALLEEGRTSQLTTLDFDKNDPGYASLKKKYLLESGLNLDAVADPSYARNVDTILRTRQQARDALAREGIETDALGNVRTEDQQKLQSLVNRGLGADVDRVTKALWDLARMNAREVEAVLAGCQGSSYCPVSEKDLRAAKEEERKLLKTRTANYDRWKTLAAKAELERLKKEATERQNREDKGIDEADRKEVENTKAEIDKGKKKKVDLENTHSAQKARTAQRRAEILSKLKNEWIPEREKARLLEKGEKGETIYIYPTLDEDSFNTDPDYVISLVNKYAPREFFSDKLDSDVYNLREDFRNDARAAVATEGRIAQLDQEVAALESQNHALITKNRWEGKDDVAAELSLLAGQYEQVGNIVNGPSIAAEGGITEVVKLGTDAQGNVVEVERIDVSVLAGQTLVSEETKTNLLGRAARQQRDETLDQAALLFDYHRGGEATEILNSVKEKNPELAQELEAATRAGAVLRPELATLRKAEIAKGRYDERVFADRIKELENQDYQKKLQKREEDLGVGEEFIAAWQGLSATSFITPSLTGASEIARFGEASVGFLFKASEDLGADVLGITAVKEDLDKDAFAEQQRQLQQLRTLKAKVEDYHAKGLSTEQAFADARAGVTRTFGGVVIADSDDLQINVGDEPAAALLEFESTRQVFSKEDRAAMESLLPYERAAFIQQRQEEYDAERREFEFDLAARDAENAVRFNRDKLAGEPAALYREAVAICPDCAGAEIVQQKLDTLDENVAGEIIATFIEFVPIIPITPFLSKETREELGETIASAGEKVGIRYTAETEQTFRDPAIAIATDATNVFDALEVLPAALKVVKALSKLSDLKKGVAAASTALDAVRFASKESRAALAAAKAAERSATTVGAAAETRRAVEAAKTAIEAEVKAGTQASKYQKAKRLLNANSYERDFIKLRNAEVDNIAEQTQKFNQAQRDFSAAQQSEDVVAQGQALTRISDSYSSIEQSVRAIDDVDETLRVSRIAGSPDGVVRRTGETTLPRTISPADTEVRVAEENVRRANQAAEATAARALPGDAPDAVISRARADAAKENLGQAVERVKDAYDARKTEVGKSVIKSRIEEARQAATQGQADEVLTAIGNDGAAKVDALVDNPTVRLEPEGTGLRFEVPDDAPLQLRIEVEEGNQLLLRIDTTNARAEGELEGQVLEALADGEAVTARNVRTQRLKSSGASFAPEGPEAGVSGIFDGCKSAPGIIVGSACTIPEVVVSELDVSGVRSVPTPQQTIDDLVRQSPELASPELRQGLERVVDSGEYLDDAVRNAANDAAGIRRQLGSDYNPDNYFAAVLNNIEQRRATNDLIRFDDLVEHQRREALLRLAVEANPNLHWNYEYHSLTSFMPDLRNKVQNVLRRAPDYGLLDELAKTNDEVRDALSVLRSQSSLPQNELTKIDALLNSELEKASINPAINPNLRKKVQDLLRQQNDYRSTDDLLFNLLDELSKTNNEVREAYQILDNQRSFTSLPPDEVARIENLLNSEFEKALQNPAILQASAKIEDSTLAQQLANNFATGEKGSYDNVVKNLQGYKREGAGWAFRPEPVSTPLVEGKRVVRYRDVRHDFGSGKGNFVAGNNPFWSKAPGPVELNRRNQYQAILPEWFDGPGEDFRLSLGFDGPVGDINHLDEYDGAIGAQISKTDDFYRGGFSQTYSEKQYAQAIDSILENNKDFFRARGFNPDVENPRELLIRIASKEGEVSLSYKSAEGAEVATLAIQKLPSEPGVLSTRATEAIPLERRVGVSDTLQGCAIYPGTLVGAACTIPERAAKPADDHLLRYNVDSLSDTQRAEVRDWITEAQRRGFSDETIEGALPRQIERVSGESAVLSNEGRALEDLATFASPEEVRNAEIYLGKAKKVREIPLQQGEVVHATTSDAALDIISSGKLRTTSGEYGQGVYAVEARASGRMVDTAAEASGYLSRGDITKEGLSPVLVRVKPEYVQAHLPLSRGATAQTRIFADEIPIEHLEFNSGEGWENAGEFLQREARPSVGEAPEISQIKPLPQIPDQLRPLTASEVQNPAELDAFNDVVATAQSPEGVSPIQRVKLEHSPLHILEDEFSVTLQVPDDARKALGIADDAVIKVQVAIPTPGEASVAEQADILADFAKDDIAPDVLGKGDKYYIAKKAEGTPLDELPYETIAQLRPQLEKIHFIATAKNYDLTGLTLDDLVFNPATGEVIVQNARKISFSTQPLADLAASNVQKIDSLLAYRVTPEQKAEAIAEARRRLEAIGESSRTPLEKVEVPSAAAPTDLSTAPLGQNVKIRSVDGTVEGRFLGSDGQNIIIETTQKREGVLRYFFPEKKVQQKIPLGNVVPAGEPIHIRSRPRRGVGGQDLSGDLYVGKYLGEDEANLYLDIRGTPRSVPKNGLDLPSLTTTSRAGVSNPGLEFNLHQQRILDQTNRVPTIDGKQNLVVHVDPASMRIQGVGSVPQEVLGNSVAVRIVVDAETGRIVDVVGEGASSGVAGQYRNSIVGEELFEGRAGVSGIFDGCKSAPGIIVGSACRIPEVVDEFTRTDGTVVPLDTTNAETTFIRADGQPTSYRMAGTISGDAGGRLRVLELDQNLDSWVNYNIRDGDRFRGNPEDNIQIFGEAAAAQLGITKEGSNLILLPDATELNVRLDRLDALVQDPQLKTNIRFYDATGRVFPEDYLRRWAYEGKLPLATQGDEALHDINVHAKGALLPNEQVGISQDQARIYLNWGEFIEARGLRDLPGGGSLGITYDEGLVKLVDDVDSMTGFDFINENYLPSSFVGRGTPLEALKRKVFPFGIDSRAADPKIVKVFREFSEQAAKDPSFTTRIPLSDDDVEILIKRRLENVKKSAKIAPPLRVEVPVARIPEPLPISERAPAEISQEINTIKQGYQSQGIDLETIIKEHSDIKVEKAEVIFKGKIGEGKVGVVYGGSIPGVGEDLAFKTAKVDTPRRGLQENVDGLFKELENAEGVCKHMACPKYHGIYVIDGVPYLVTDRVPGKQLFDMSDQELVQYLTPERIDKFRDELTEAVKAGAKPIDEQVMILDEPFDVVRNGEVIRYKQGDFVTIDVMEWGQDGSIKRFFNRILGIDKRRVDFSVQRTIEGPLEAAKKSLNFKKRTPEFAKAIEEASLDDLQVALRNLGVTNENELNELVQYISNPKQRIHRLYITDLDHVPLTFVDPEDLARNLPEISTSTQVPTVAKRFPPVEKVSTPSQAAAISEPVSGVRIITPDAPLEAAPEALYKGKDSQGRDAFLLGGEEYYETAQGTVKRKRAFPPWDERIDKTQHPEIFAEIDNAKAVEGLPRRVEDSIPEWKEAVSPEGRVKLQQQAAASKAPVIIGEGKFYTTKKNKFLFFFTRDEVVEGVQTIKYLPDGSLAIEIKNPITDQPIASHYYKVNGNEMEIDFTFVAPDYQGAGVNRRIMQQTGELHPEVDYVKGFLTGTNRDPYIDYLRRNPGATPVEAIKETPAYKIMESAGWELDVERSSLPTLDNIDEGLVLVSRKKAGEELKSLDLPPCPPGGAIVGQAASIGCTLPTVDTDAYHVTGGVKLEGRTYTYDAVTNQYAGERWYWADKEIPVGSDLHNQLEAARVEKKVNYPRTLADLEEGRNFLIFSYTDKRHIRGGEFKNVANSPITDEVDINMKNGFDFETSGVISDSDLIPLLSVDLNSLIVEGDLLRLTERVPSFETPSTAVVRFDGFSEGKIKVTRLDDGRQIVVPFNAIDFNKLIIEGDEIVVEGTFPAVYRGSAVSEVRGQYLREDTTTLTLYVDGKVVVFDKNNLKMETLEKTQNLDE